MAVVILQHTPGVAPHAFVVATEAAGLDLRVHRVWAGDLPGDLTGVDALVVTGDPDDPRADEGATARHAELTLLRAALDAEVPVLGVCQGARRLATAAGGAAPFPVDPRLGWAPLKVTSAAASDPLFARLPGRPYVPRRNRDRLELPQGAVVLASDDRHAVQAFRIGAGAWGLRFPLEVDCAAADEETATGPTAPEPWWGRVPARFVALAAARAGTTAVRAFFTQRAGAWGAGGPTRLRSTSPPSPGWG